MCGDTRLHKCLQRQLEGQRLMCVCFFFFFVLASSAFPSPLRSNVEVGAIVWSTVDKLFPRFVWHTFLLLRFLENSSAFWRHFFFFFYI